MKGREDQLSSPSMRALTVPSCLRSAQLDYVWPNTGGAERARAGPRGTGRGRAGPSKNEWSRTKRCVRNPPSPPCRSRQRITKMAVTSQR